MPTAGAAELVEATLAEHGAVTRRALLSYLPGDGRHRGLYASATDYPRRGGKMLRSSLCIATARSFGASVERAVRSAVAIELMHNAMLIHDDIEDGSEERRGRPTLHVLHGVPTAINAGDMLTLLALRPLIENATAVGPWLAMRILEDAERMARESAEGQAMELRWRHGNACDLADADYLEMVTKKTSWLMAIHPCRVGALLGAGSAAPVDEFIRFGVYFGAAFQIHDDVLNLTADGGRYGKERDGDLWEGKRTLMLLRALRGASSEERQRMARLLATPRDMKDEGEVAWLRDLMETRGCIDEAREVARGLAGAAIHEHERIFRGLPASRDRDFIEALATWVVERGH